VLVVVGLSHHSASVEVRERFAFNKEDAVATLRRAGAAFGPAVLLSTCNRTELYLASYRSHGEAAEVVDFLAAERGLTATAPVHEHFYFHGDDSAVRHLFQVAAGLDSMVLGESEILGQVRDAMRLGHEAESLDRLLSHLMHTAIRVGRRARSETKIGHLAVSASSAAVDLARRIFPDLETRTVVVVSAGEAGKLAVRALQASGVGRLVVTSRRRESAEELAALLGGEAASFAELPQLLVAADVVVSSSSAPGHLLEYEEVSAAMPARAGRPLLLVDLAVPRDVDPRVAELPEVRLYNIDDVQAHATANLLEREREALAVEPIVEEELRRFQEWRHSLAAAPTIAALREHAESIRRQELGRTFARMGDLSEGDQERIDALTRAIVKKLLHTPFSRIKDPDDGPRFAEAARDLFDLQA
jgi:glutamyl-tRNA reductase